MEHRYETNNNTHHSKIQIYLTASKHFLQHRNFQDCIKYALKAIEINPNHTQTSQILAIAKVLLHSDVEPNYYSILDLPNYTQDQQLIKNNFKNVTNLLNPNKNVYPFASEAFKVVLRAWSVLSNPTHKIRFDNGLKIKKKKEEGTYMNTFWTVCPYCYYVYEFFKVYEDCLVRCQNCKRGFHALQIVGPPPPADVAEKGEYYCFGFSVLGVKGKSLWSPFVYKNEEGFNVDEFIDISDDEAEEDGNGKKEEFLGVEKEFVKTNGGEVEKGKKKRMKMVGKCTKKVLGKGNRVNMNEVVYSEVEGNDDFFGNVGEKIKENNNVEFFVGDDDDDDIYVGLQEDLDMGVEDIGTLFF